MEKLVSGLDVVGMKPEGVAVARRAVRAFMEGMSPEEIAGMEKLKVSEIQILIAVANKFGYL